jgi:PAS domain-containing protein
VRLTGGGETVAFEFRIRSADRGFRSLLFSGIGVPEDGFIYAAAKDVTEQREAEALFEAAFSKASLAMLLVSVDPERFGRITAANPAAARLTGYSESQLASRDFQSLMHPDDLDDIIVEVERPARRGDRKLRAREALTSTPTAGPSGGTCRRRGRPRRSPRSTSAAAMA